MTDVGFTRTLLRRASMPPHQHHQRCTWTIPQGAKSEKERRSVRDVVPVEVNERQQCPNMKICNILQLSFSYILCPRL